MADWQSLPVDVLPSISDGLKCTDDYIRFRAVCTSWRSAAPKSAHHRSCPICMARPPTAPSPLSPLPCLLAQREHQQHENHTTFTFFYLLTDAPKPTSTRSSPQLLTLSPIPQLPSATLTVLCRGCSHGWMALLDRSPAFTLLNPVTWSHIRLPPSTVLPDLFGYTFHKVNDDEYQRRRIFSPHLVDSTHTFSQMADYLANKVILSSDPATPGCVAMLIRCHWQRVAICRLGEFDNSWTPLRFPDFRSKSLDAAFYKGQFYVASYHSMYRCNVGSEEQPSFEQIPLSIAGEPADALDTWGEPAIKEKDEVYLLESYGDLWMVMVSYGRQGRYRFDVFMVDWRKNSKTARLQKLRSLGDRALFLGRNQSFSLPATRISGLRGNCIYMAECYKEGQRAVRVYDMDSGSNVIIPITRCTNLCKPLAWMFPSSLGQ